MKFTIKAKLILGFSCLIVLMGVITFLSLSKLSGLNDNLVTIVDSSAEKIKLAARINQGVLAISRAEKNIILAETQEEMDVYADYSNQTQKEMEDRLETLNTLADDNGKTYLTEFNKTWNEYLAINKEIIDLAQLNSNVEAELLSLGDGRAAYDATAQMIDGIIEKAEAESDQASQANDTQQMVLAAKKKSNL